MILERFTKQPDEAKDYDVDYAPWLSTVGDTIDNVTATVVCTSNAGDTSLVIQSVSSTTTRIKLWITGGVSGYRYKITLKVTTVGGRIDESELVFSIKDN